MQEDGYTRDHPVIVNFWKVVHSMSMEEKKKLLSFCTGSDRSPIRGLGRFLEGERERASESERARERARARERERARERARARFRAREQARERGEREETAYKARYSITFTLLLRPTVLPPAPCLSPFFLCCSLGPEAVPSTCERR